MLTSEGNGKRIFQIIHISWWLSSSLSLLLPHLLFLHSHKLIPLLSPSLPLPYFLLSLSCYHTPYFSFPTSPPQFTTTFLLLLPSLYITPLTSPTSHRFSYLPSFYFPLLPYSPSPISSIDPAVPLLYTMLPYSSFLFPDFPFTTFSCFSYNLCSSSCASPIVATISSLPITPPPSPACQPSTSSKNGQRQKNVAEFKCSFKIN